MMSMFVKVNAQDNFSLCFFRCHLPMLYIGLEYGLTNNSKLAERFFSQALSIAPEDPFVIHEVAVVAFQNGEWVTAQHTPTLHKSHTVLKLQSLGNSVALVQRSEQTQTYWGGRILILCSSAPSAGRTQSAYFLTQWRRSKPSAAR